MLKQEDLPSFLSNKLGRKEGYYMLGEYKLKLLINRFWKIIVSLFIIFIFIYASIQVANKLDLNNSATAAWVGVIYGSLISGTLTYLGAERVKVREVSKNAMKERKESIYEPLYEDLLKLRNDLKFHPYPIHIENDRHSKDYLINFKEWDKIKNDARYLSLPPDLIVHFNNLIKDFELYNDYVLTFVSEVNDAMEEKIKTKIGCRFRSVMRIEDIKYVLFDGENFIYRLKRTTLWDLETNAYAYEDKKISNSLAEEIMYDVSEMGVTYEIERRYNNITNKVEALLGVLEMFIKDINKKLYGTRIY